MKIFIIICFLVGSIYGQHNQTKFRKNEEVFISSVDKVTSIVDTTVIDSRKIDSTLYLDMFSQKCTVNVSIASFNEPILYDYDKDGQGEIYGFYYNNISIPDSLGLICKEFDKEKNQFLHRRSYPDSAMIPRMVVDLDKDGYPEFLANTFLQPDFSEIWAFTKPENDPLPIERKFTYNAKNQMNDHYYIDLDNDGLEEYLYLDFDDSTIVIMRYNPLLNNFEKIYSHHPPFRNPGGGFGIGDLDEDGYPEISYGDLWGNYVIYEYQEGEGFKDIWYGTVETYNVIHHFVTNDINGNGKKELWIGGDATYYNKTATRFTCFEATGNNTYEPVHVIDIDWIFSFFAGNSFASDINNDGKEEIFLCLDQHIFILEYNEGEYEIYYTLKNPRRFEFTLFTGATIFDIDNNGLNELVISGYWYGNEERYDFSTLYEINPGLVSVNEDNIIETLPEDFQLNQNYPNPFNGQTRISFNLPERGLLEIRIYDTLGRLVDEFSKEYGSGIHEYIWNTDKSKNLSTGLYLINVKYMTFNKTIKTILLK
ncbi:MAG: hypothetical protein SCALA702_24200 [Melioribacteraceae bacterium]|nr:MAG: hypothetical protein SCALA702_24200 [Melioribacteraceae bacterium]